MTINKSVLNSLSLEYLICFFILLILAFFCPIICCYFSVILCAFLKNNKHVKNFTLFILILIFSFGAYSRGLWSDTQHYLNFIRSINSPNEVFLQALIYLNSVDIGFALLTFIIKYIFKNEFVVLFVLTIISTILYARIYKQFNDKMALFSILYFYSSFTFYFLVGNQIRQAIAGAFGLFAIASVCSKSYIKSYFYCLLAISFHLSSLLFLPIIWALNSYSKFNDIKRIVFVFISVIISLLLLNNIINYFPENSFVYMKINGMLNRGGEIKSLFSASSLKSFLLLGFILCITYMYDSFKLNTKFKMLFISYLYFYLFELAFISSAELSNRIANYKLIIEPLILIEIIQFFREKKELSICFWIATSVFFSYVITGPANSFFNSKGISVLWTPIWNLIIL